MSKCIGCGAILQTDLKESIGYTTSLENKLCERCFRIRNYNDYKFVVKDNNDYINILKDVNKTNDLVVLVVDLFNISYDLNVIGKYINNKILLVLTKRDIIPKSCYDENLKEYFKNYDLNIIDTVVVSSNKNYNLDVLFNKINQNKISNNVYVVGFTNSGKSTLINKMLYNYSDNNTVITTSNLPSTTIDSINVKVNENLTLIDTPGLLNDKDISNYIDGKTLKKIVPKSEIKPITYQIKEDQTIIIDDLAKISIKKGNNITIYASNNLEIKRVYKSVEKVDYNEIKISIPEFSDIVIEGLCFIKFTKETDVVVYTKYDSLVYFRKNLI